MTVYFFRLILRRLDGPALAAGVFSRVPRTLLPSPPLLSIQLSVNDLQISCRTS